MLFPTLYRENLFDGLDPFDRMMNGTNGWGLEFPSEKRDPLFGKHAARVMRTDSGNSRRVTRSTSICRASRRKTSRPN